MNHNRKEEREKGWISRRLARGLRAFGRRHFTFGSNKYRKKIKYDRELRKNSPAFQIIWMFILIGLFIILRGENTIYILYVFLPVYLLLLLWEIWIIGAPAKNKEEK